MMHSYEKIPRKMARTEEKEVIHLLPIKDKTGIIPQSMERGTVLVVMQKRSSLEKASSQAWACSTQEMGMDHHILNVII